MLAWSRGGRRAPLLCLFSHFEKGKARKAQSPLAARPRLPACLPGSQPALGALWGASQPSTQLGRRAGRRPIPPQKHLLLFCSRTGLCECLKVHEALGAQKGAWHPSKQRLACHSLSPQGPPGRVQGSGMAWTHLIGPCPDSAASPLPPTPRDQGCFIWWMWVFVVPLGSLLKM